MGEPAVLPLYCPTQPYHLDCLYNKLIRTHKKLQQRGGSVITRQVGKRQVWIEVGKPGTYIVEIRTPKLVRVFEIKADKEGNVGLFV